ncbi:MAG: hypothetical protein E7608_04970 [Ruminococcaceae bacterium]|nr:hypothetical protein [Oscillospiraceae bacterium]
MKKILSLALALAMCLICFVGCTQIEDDDPNGKGAKIDVYMGTKVYDLDPAIAYTDESTSKILSLIFEGLMEIDENGKLSNALMKEYEIAENPKTGVTEMDITINETYWSDGSLVQTNDIIYAWKRILDPTFNSPAAAMLYCIKGAYDRKMGNIGEDDIGIYSRSKDKMTIEFEDGADIDEFLYSLASLALVPVRETKVKTYADTWSKKSSDLSTNGAFKVKKFSGNVGEEIILERSTYYYLSQQTNTEALDKYVTPYQIIFHYAEPLDTSVVYSPNAETDIISLVAGEDLFYVSNLTASVLDNFKSSDVKYKDIASTYSYYFNTNSAIGSNAVVRNALSIALDRTAIAEALGNKSEAATGLIPSMIFDTKKGTSFRKEGGDILSASSNITAAQNALSEAGVNPADYEEIYLYYIKDTTNDSYQSASTEHGFGYMSKEKTIATYAKQAWEQLGFKVVLKGVTAEEHAKVYANGQYDVIGLDYQMMSAYPIYALASFATAYSGRVLETETASDVTYTALPHVSGYTSEEYDALIASAFAAGSQKEKAEILHKAEELLLKDAPVVPVIFNSEAYVTSGLSDLETNFWGATDFKKAYLNNYVEYLATTIATTNPDDEKTAG